MWFRRSHKLVALSCVLLLLVAAVVAGCSPAEPEEPTGETGTEEPPAEPAHENTLVVAGSGDLDTALWTHSGLFLIDQLLTWMGEPLVYQHPDGTIVPGIADDWDISEDGTEYTFYLNPDAKFHDGTPVTAKDVAFTIEATIWPDIPSGGGPSLMLKGADAYASGEADSVEGIDIVDDHTIHLVFGTPQGQVMNILAADAILPEHILGDVPLEDWANHDMNTAPIYAGPYKMTKWTKGSEMVFERFDDYFGDLAPFDKIIYRIIPEASTRLAELKAGNVDVVIDLPVDYVDDVESDANLKVFETPGPFGRHVMFNLNNAPWRDLRVRQALSHAFDFQAILDGIYKGHGQLSVSLFHPAEWEYDDDLQPYTYDPDKAKDLLAEAGWTDEDGDGFVEAHGVDGVADGTKLTASMPVTSKPYEDVSLVLAESLKAIGIDASVEMYESNVYWSDIYVPHSTKWDVMYAGWGSSFVGAWPSSRGMEYNFGGVDTAEHQTVGWDDTELASMIDEVLTIVDQDQAKVLWDDIQARIFDQVYRIHAFRESYFIAYDADLEVDLSEPIWDIMWLKFGRSASWK